MAFSMTSWLRPSVRTATCSADWKEARSSSPRAANSLLPVMHMNPLLRSSRCWKTPPFLMSGKYPIARSTPPDSSPSSSFSTIGDTVRSRTHGACLRTALITIGR